jgi:uncharacterized protein
MSGAANTTLRPELPYPLPRLSPVKSREERRRMSDNAVKALNEKIERLIEAVSRLSAAPSPPPDFDSAGCFVWEPDAARLAPVHRVNRVELKLIRGVDHVRDILVENTRRFANGLPANNTLLWGARGMGKSSLVKAVHADIAGTLEKGAEALKLIEIHREDINTLPKLMSLVRGAPHRFILFCDDLSFDAGDTSYKSLKAALEGGVEGRPDNVIFFATSNRRHLLPRDMIENERSTSINPYETVEEKVSLSDRFGLWLGFHKCSQDEYLDMVQSYAAHHGLKTAPETLQTEALEWATTRGSRSGRVAFQFIQDLAGRMGKSLRQE